VETQVRSLKVIFNADDFGRSENINAAVLQAHRRGVLTSASLMIAGEAAASAVEIARRHPRLAVGLHVVTANGRAALPPGQIPHLADASGNLVGGAAFLGLRYFLNPVYQTELFREIRAQFELFAGTALPLSHVDGHMHMHMVPTIFRETVALAARYGAKGFRLPRDDLHLALQNDPRNRAAKTAWAGVFGLLCAAQLPPLRKSGLVFTDRVIGLFQSGRMHAAYVVRALQQLNCASAELYFHPSVEQGPEPLGPNPGDLAALLDPAVREAIRRRGLQPATYPSLRDD
jgi:hopanoid biosynthesis associated protein HpnK